MRASLEHMQDTKTPKTMQKASAAAVVLGPGTAGTAGTVGSDMDTVVVWRIEDDGGGGGGGGAAAADALMPMVLHASLVFATNELSTELCQRAARVCTTAPLHHCTTTTAPQRVPLGQPPLISQLQKCLPSALASALSHANRASRLTDIQLCTLQPLAWSATGG
ncbi:hypothetical protein K504DRAFT_502953 [Pleomassaria siparia CBS 279.74]|uniref:Uncharacterized protein n=1 Tax=Pleomassaria siparia CBS 279.74 TaxID=1314801 RepID=A0A6G1K807_9PLEO|nr:hypothetical protein K504DRAFT_502953 [Pleomassaria siparia CBS 279.74]